MMNMLLFRCCSFSFEQNEFSNSFDSITDYFNYIFYLPTFIMGPVVTYDQVKDITCKNKHEDIR